MQFTVEVSAAVVEAATDGELGEKMFVVLEGRGVNVLAVSQETEDGVICVGMGVEAPGAREAVVWAVGAFLAACEGAGIREDVDRSTRRLSVTVEPYDPVAATAEPLVAG